MSKSINADFVGQVGVSPRLVRIATSDSLATVTAAGWITPDEQQLYQLTSYDFVFCAYNSGANQVILSVAVSAAGVVTLSELADQTGAIFLGDVQAGASGTAGAFLSYPSTASKGYLKLAAAANSGNTATTITNASMGQATVLTIPDPAGATANMVVAPSALVSGNFVKASGTAGLVVDGGAKILAQTTLTYGGGGTSNVFTATGLTATSKVAASILTQTNAASIVKAVPGTDTLTVTFSADPGAGTTINWVALSATV